MSKHSWKHADGRDWYDCANCDYAISALILFSHNKGEWVVGARLWESLDNLAEANGKEACPQ